MISDTIKITVHITDLAATCCETIN